MFSIPNRDTYPFASPYGRYPAFPVTSPAGGPTGKAPYYWPPFEGGKDTLEKSVKPVDGVQSNNASIAQPAKDASANSSSPITSPQPGQPPLPTPPNNATEAPKPPAPTKAAKKDEKKKNDDPKTPKYHTPGGGASNWVSMFKVMFSLLVAGGVNTFLFGVPFWVAAGLSTAVAGTQSAIALKIHKEDNAASRKILKFSRKLMRREKDNTPSGKEWAMVPVWGIVSLVLAGVEGLANVQYEKKHPKPSLDTRIKTLEAQLENAQNSITRAFYKLQLKGSHFTQRGFGIKELCQKQGIKGSVLESALKKLLSVINTEKGKAKTPYALLWGCLMAMFGGIFQTMLAANMQTRIDRNHGLKF